MKSYTLDNTDKTIMQAVAQIAKSHGIKLSDWANDFIAGSDRNLFRYIKLHEKEEGHSRYQLGGSDSLENPLTVDEFVKKAIELAKKRATDVSFSNGQTGQVFMDRIVVGCTTVINKEVDELIKAMDELTINKPRLHYSVFEHSPFRSVVIQGILSKYNYTCKIPAFELPGEFMIFDLNEKTITNQNRKPVDIPNHSIGFIIGEIDKVNNPSYSVKIVHINNNKVISVTPTEVIHEGYTFSHAEVRQVKQIMDRLNKKS